MSTKRPRSGSQVSLSQSPAPPSEPTPKAVRTSLPVVSSPAAPLLCTLPPTCNPPQNRPTPIANSSDLEAHYATYHAHVCEDKGCGCVFPEARLLQLHQTECHDPIAAVRKERGEKIFACHLVACSRLFHTPKTRRLHLIQAHGYPKEYFFAVTNKGVGGLLKKWGEGASMIRGEWKARDHDQMDDDSESEPEDADEDEETKDVDEGVASGEDHAKQTFPIEEDSTDEDSTANDNAVQDLTGALDALSLVPPNVQFGRGGKGGFRHGLGHTVPVPIPGVIPIHGGPLQRRGFGRGRGRGRGRGNLSGGGGVTATSGTGTGVVGDARTTGVGRGALGTGSMTRGIRGSPHARVRVNVAHMAGRGERGP